MSKQKKSIFMITIGIFLFVAPSILAHKGKKHDNHEESDDSSPSTAETLALEKLNEEYISKIKPIFQRSCMDCHSSNTNYPWYHIIPGVKQLIDGDIEEAKSHLDMTNDFPFGGHGTPIEDLKAIQDSLNSKKMPPLRYITIHWSSRIKPDELDTIRTWIRNGLRELDSQSTNN